MAHLESCRADSVGVFKPFWLCWRFLGVLSWQEKNVTIIYDICLNLFVYILYPVHLTLGLLLLSSMQYDLYKNMPLTIACIVCTMKHYCIKWKFKSIHEMMNLFAKLDKRIQCLEERKYFVTNSMRIATLLTKVYFSAYMGVNMTVLMVFLLDEDTRLLHSAWFPFDWSSSVVLYYLALIYQFVGMTILVVLNFTNDAILPVTLCLLTGQIHVLSMRVAKLGYNKRLSCDQQEHELKLCIEDHIKLINLFHVMMDAMSYVQLLLFISSSLIICMVLVSLFFVVGNLLSYIYYTSFLIAIAVELFPIYYLGSLMQEEFDHFPYAIFSSNWTCQTRSYRKSIIIFSEVALRNLTVVAGGFVAINLDSFFAILKMTYSLLAVAMNMK